MIKEQAVNMVFMALVIWREARGECREAKEAVAGCILNRVRFSGWWGRDIMGCLFKKWQFSSVTDPKDKQLTTWPSPTDPSWAECLEIAERAVSDELEHPAPGADSYFDISIPDPIWATGKTFVRQIGRIKFYNTDRK